ncbi:hypothetical protein [Pseudooceanicola sp. MF1-13]|uniref:hypothetical protein n=1 Tax=Pseudooceanicola sp. MF1-13 TaxID=3379095 RepID=UPI003891E0DE
MAYFEGAAQAKDIASSKRSFATVTNVLSCPSYRRTTSRCAMHKCLQMLVAAFCCAWLDCPQWAESEIAANW